MSYEFYTDDDLKEYYSSVNPQEKRKITLELRRRKMIVTSGNEIVGIHCANCKHFITEPSNIFFISYICPLCKFEGYANVKSIKLRSVNKMTTIKTKEDALKYIKECMRESKSCEEEIKSATERKSDYEDEVERFRNQFNITDSEYLELQEELKNE